MESIRQQVVLSPAPDETDHDRLRTLTENALLFDSVVTVTRVTTTTAVTLGDSDFVILVDDDAAGALVTVTLPPLAASPGRNFHVKKIGTTANVDLTADGGETIDGFAVQTISTQYDSIHVVAGASEWSIV